MDVERNLLGTGIAGLDEVLSGGIQPHKLYLVSGAPGTGKTTLALQFVLEGLRAQQQVLYVALSESVSEIQDLAQSHGWVGIDKMHIHELRASQDTLDAERQYTFFHASEVEFGNTMNAIVALLDEVRPSRVVFDSLSELRVLARTELQYRRQLLALKDLLTRRGCTTLLLDTGTHSEDTFTLDTLAHGVILLDQRAPNYGVSRRRLRIGKVRGQDFLDGFHDYVLRRGGLQVFPRLVSPQQFDTDGGQEGDRVTSQVPALDELVGGGLDRGTSTMAVGPSGVGKSTLLSQYVAAAARRGEKSLVFLFDERRSGWLGRGDTLGMALSRHVEAGLIEVEHINPAALSPGELAFRVRTQIEEREVRLVVLDSINGYELAMPDEHYLALHLNEMISFIGRHGVNLLIALEQRGLLGSEVAAASSVTYIADNVLLLRYFEAFGEVRRALSVIKKRTGRHEHRIREFTIEKGVGLSLGAPVLEFNGVLSGSPRFVGVTRSSLLDVPENEPL